MLAYLAERCVQSIMNKTITIMADNNASEYYLEQAIDTVVYY